MARLFMSDGKDLEFNVFNSKIPDSSKVMVIVHGMTEHSKRYEHFANFLSDNGITVVTYDQRCHGQSIDKPEDLGHLVAKNGFDRVTEDLHGVVSHVKYTFKGEDIYVMGHSFGSFVTQNYLEKYDDGIKGAILLGTAGPKTLTMFFGRILAWFVKLFKGQRKTSKLLHYVMHGNYNKKFPNETEYAWLSRDMNIQRAFIDDPLCGFEPTIGFRYTFLGGLFNIHLKKNIHKMLNVPILILGGDMDPVGNYGESVKNLGTALNEDGRENVTLLLYKDNRHELLNELDKEKVYNEILNWVRK